MTRENVQVETIIQNGLIKACEALSTIMARRFDPAGTVVSYHDPMELPSLWSTKGDAAVCAAFYQVEGDLSGYLMLVIPFSDVDGMVRLLLDPGTADDDLVDSALGEVGNIVGSAFLNYLADYFHISAAPTPPQVIRDMMGALLQTLAAVAASEGKAQIPIIRSSFTRNEDALATFLLWMTDVEEIRRLGGRR